ncbi:MAG: pitrilysin family protein [Candidatus Spechtbacterales bacterium]
MNGHRLTRLETGLRVITVPFTTTKTVSALLFVKTGGHNESKELSGLSHYLEHLFFKGSKKYPDPYTISVLLDSIGGDYNAFTADEYTGFYIKVAADKLGVGLGVMSDFLHNPLFTPAEIEREKGVILEELHMYYDTPQRQVVENFEHAIYGDQPAGRDVGGSVGSVAAITRDDVLSYFKKQYRVEDMVLVFAGNLEYEEGVALAKKYFSNIPQGAAEPKRPVTYPSVGAPLVELEHRTTDQTHMALGFRGVSLRDERRFALSVLAVVLGSGMSSRLFMEVREKRALAYQVNMTNQSGTDYGHTWVASGIANAKLEEAVEVIIGELHRIKEELVDKDELQKAKNIIEGHTYIALEESDAVAAHWGEQELLLGEAKSPEEHLDNIRAVTARDVQNVANEIFLKEEVRLALIGPYKNEAKLHKILSQL